MNKINAYRLIICLLFALNIWQCIEPNDHNDSVQPNFDQNKVTFSDDTKQLLNTIAELQIKLTAQSKNSQHRADNAHPKASFFNTTVLNNDQQNSEALNRRAEQQLSLHYGPLLHVLSDELSDSEISSLKATLIHAITQGIIFGDNEVVNHLDTRIFSLLGERQYALYEAFKEHGHTSSSFVQTFNHDLFSSSSEALSDEQQKALSLLLVKAKTGGLSEIYGSLHNALEVEALQRGMSVDEFLSSESSYEVRQQIVKTRILDQADAILTLEQLRQFEQRPEWNYLSENAQVF